MCAFSSVSYCFLPFTNYLRRSSDGFVDWTFSTVRCWGEKPQGTWQLIVVDNGMQLIRFLVVQHYTFSFPFLFTLMVFIFDECYGHPAILILMGVLKSY